MKGIFANLALFVILTIVFSGFTGCKNTGNSQNGAPAESPAPANDNTTNSTAPAGNNNDANGTASSEFPPAPSVFTDSEIKGIDGGTFKLGDRKGQVILVNLWATWCGPCREEMPELVAMQNKYSDKNFKVVGLNISEESVDMIKEFAADLKLNYELAWADQKMLAGINRYSRFQAIPQSFLIDREGRLRGVFLGGGPAVVPKMVQAVEKVVNE